MLKGKYTLNVNVLCLKQVFPLFRSTMFFFPFFIIFTLLITVATGVNFLLSTIYVLKLAFNLLVWFNDNFYSI